jgi:hypothetical protein
MSERHFTDDFLVLVKFDAFDEAGEAAQLLKPRIKKPILLPGNPRVWPGREFLAWHPNRHGFSR